MTFAPLSYPPLLGLQKGTRRRIELIANLGTCAVGRTKSTRTVHALQSDILQMANPHTRGNILAPAMVNLNL